MSNFYFTSKTKNEKLNSQFTWIMNATDWKNTIYNLDNTKCPNSDILESYYYQREWVLIFGLQTTSEFFIYLYIYIFLSVFLMDRQGMLLEIEDWKFLLGVVRD